MNQPLSVGDPPPPWPRPEDPAAGIGTDVIRLSKLLTRVRAQRPPLLPGVDVSAPPILFALAHGPLRVTTLAERIFSDASTASRQVAALEQHGLVARDPDPADRRASVIRITEKGADFAATLLERRNVIFRSIVQDWPEDDVQTLADLLHRFLADAVERADQLMSTPTEGTPQ